MGWTTVFIGLVDARGEGRDGGDRARVEVTIVVVKETTRILNA